MNLFEALWVLNFQRFYRISPFVVEKNKLKTTKSMSVLTYLLIVFFVTTMYISNENRQKHITELPYGEFVITQCSHICNLLIESLSHYQVRVRI